MKKENNKIYIIDTTLRDGEQAPSIAFSNRNKLRLAEMLASAGVDELEAGTPAMGENEKSCIRSIVNLHLPCRVSCWCRAKREDLEAAAETKADSVHISFPVSSILLKAMGKDEAWVFNALEKLVPSASQIFSRVSVGAMDATRADMSFLLKFTVFASSCGASRMRIADTVGIASPLQIMDMLQTLRKVTNKIPFEFHGHNDLGMATATSICAISAGAEALSVTVNGLGERAGNAALEEIVLALPVCTGKSCNIRPDKLMSLCNFVSRISNRKIPDNKPVTGSLVFTHESGIHCHALLKDDSAYQPYNPALIGRKTKFVIGKHSGSTIIRHMLKQRKNTVELCNSAVTG